MPALAAIIPFPQASASGSVGEYVAPAIREAYGRIEAASAGRGGQFSVRDSQLRLSQHVFDACLSGNPLAAEAPTGTGKTLAYLVGAIVASAETGLPVVVATATVALQRQILGHDFTLLRAAGLTSGRDWALMLGRGRYFCPRQAQQLLDSLNSAGARQGDLFGTDSRKTVNPEIPVLLQDLIREAAAETWRGDRDTWKGSNEGFDALWPQVCANADTCTGKHCEFYESGCRYFRDRARATTASVLVTNHDLVLSDLRLRAADAPSLFPFERYILVFDEAHQLPDKAVSSSASGIVEHDLLQCLPLMQRLQERAAGSGWLQAGLAAAGQNPDQLDTARLSGLLARLRELADKFDLAPDEHVPFGREKPPGGLDTLAEQLAVAVEIPLAAIKTLVDLLRARTADQQDDPAFHRHLEQLVSGVQSRLRRAYAGALGFCTPGGQARWLERTADGYALQVSPLSGGEVLPGLLWQTGFPVILMSATLQALGSFDAFARDCALPASSSCVKVESSFDYGRSYIDLYSIGATPGMPEFEDALVSALGQVLTPNEGTVVLFTSYARMQRVFARLPKQLASLVLMQGSAPVQTLLEQHRRRISKGWGSILFGTDTFSEGIDLPGSLCTHVVITQLPFPQFGSPIEVSRRLEQGDAHFTQNFLPATSRKLQQAVGRLLRRESDQGRISILDARIRRRYGIGLLRALPPFSVRWFSLNPPPVSALKGTSDVA